MPAKYKQKCCKCKTNYVVVTNRSRDPVCYTCQKKELAGEIEDAEMKKMFDIPEELYVEDIFLRNIKINYLKYKRLSEKQITAFKKRVEAMLEEKSM
jgi:hypothetical protein